MTEAPFSLADSAAQVAALPAPTTITSCSGISITKVLRAGRKRRLRGKVLAGSSAAAWRCLPGYDLRNQLRIGGEPRVRRVEHCRFGNRLRSEERRVGKECRSRWSP